MPGFMEAWETLSEHYDLRFLTRPSMDNLNSYTEKAQWVRDHLGAKALEKLNLCPDKSLLIGDYLIDDWDIHGQTDFQGEFLQFGRGENCRTWNHVVEYLMSKA
jgi:5'(3')-deoxyribonucleotidase